MSNPQRMPLIDALKALASQTVLLHHLSAYGPLAEAGQRLLPTLSAWLFEYGRIAVQVFLVIAGFLAARGLSPNGEALRASPLPLLRKRYLRLVVPYLAAVALAIICAAIADQWLDDDMVPARASLGQWLAHAALLHGILGVESLSAGVWYVAIDFQLFALFALLLWVGRRRRIAPLLVLATACGSLFWFNRHAELDNWAVYFFGSYGLGAAAWWASDRRNLSFWLGLIVTVTVAALMLDFRLRIGVALCVALLLGFARRSGFLERWPNVRPLAFLGQISYSVFLVHFPILLLANTLFDRFEGDAPLPVAAAAILLTWGGAVAAGTLFFRWVEQPKATQRIIDTLAGGTLRLARPLRRVPLIGALVSRSG